MKEESRDHINLSEGETEQPTKNVGVTLEEQLEWLRKRPYNGYEAGEHKGIQAKEGYVFLVVQYKREILIGTRRSFTNARQFPIDQLDQGIKNHMYDKLWEHLKKKYASFNLPE